jgi:hypothetical protein
MRTSTNNLKVFPVVKKFLILFLVWFGISACGTGPKLKISKRPIKLDKEIQTIALMPSGGIMADSIGIDLLNYGFDIIDTATTTSVMTRVNMTEIEYSKPQNMRKLNSEGIDSIMLVKTVAGYDNQPNSISVRIILTSNGKLLVGAVWQNGSGGQMGSPLDRARRSGITEAASNIANGIAKALNN